MGGGEARDNSSGRKSAPTSLAKTAVLAAQASTKNILTAAKLPTTVIRTAAQASTEGARNAAGEVEANLGHVKAIVDVEGDGVTTSLSDARRWRKIKSRMKRPLMRCFAPLRFLDIPWRCLFPAVYLPVIRMSYKDVVLAAPSLDGAAALAGCRHRR